MRTQERDLITLALRFAVASHCGEARHKVGAYSAYRSGGQVEHRESS